MNLSTEFDLTPAEVGKLAIDTLQFLVGEMRKGSRIDIVRPDRPVTNLDLQIPGYQIDASLQDPNITIEDIFGHHS